MECESQCPKYILPKRWAFPPDATSATATDGSKNSNLRVHHRYSRFRGWARRGGLECSKKSGGKVILATGVGIKTRPIGRGRSSQPSRRSGRSLLNGDLTLHAKSIVKQSERPFSDPQAAIARGLSEGPFMAEGCRSRPIERND